MSKHYFFGSWQLDIDSSTLTVKKYLAANFAASHQAGKFKLSERIASGEIREFLEFFCYKRWLSEIVYVLEIMNRSVVRKKYGNVIFSNEPLTKKYTFWNFLLIGVVK